MNGENEQPVYYDWYMSYETISRCIESVRAANRCGKLKILEVGANAHQILRKFVDDEIFYSDIQDIPELSGDDHFFVADATNLVGILDDTYDLVIASDVYEHISRTLRKNFLRELYRVCKYGVIVCFPIGKPTTEAAERLVNDRYREKHGEDQPWLIEHIQNRLPEKAEVDSLLDEAEIPFLSFEHGDLETWKMLQTIAPLVSSDTLSGWYNSHLYDKDCTEDNYRVFYLLLKQIEDVDGLVASVEEFFSDGDPVRNMNELMMFLLEDNLGRMNQLETIVGQLADIIERQNETIEQLREN